MNSAATARTESVVRINHQWVRAAAIFAPGGENFRRWPGSRPNEGSSRTHPLVDDLVAAQLNRSADDHARLRSMINEYSEMVAHTLLASGVPQCDVDDEIQRTFLTAARRLADVHPGSERGFLYRVARHTAAHSHRARTRRREVPSGELPEVPDRSEAFASPERLAQRRQMWTLVAGALATMGESLRAVFVHDLEGMPRNEIAALLNVPEGTVASRLRLARKQLRTLVAG
jgi:RNA polymerase sigma-70 factor (ECF subfamily)